MIIVLIPLFIFCLSIYLNCKRIYKNYVYNKPKKTSEYWKFLNELDSLVNQSSIKDKTL